MGGVPEVKIPRTSAHHFHEYSVYYTSRFRVDFCHFSKQGGFYFSNSSDVDFKSKNIHPLCEDFIEFLEFSFLFY